VAELSGLISHEKEMNELPVAALDNPVPHSTPAASPAKSISAKIKPQPAVKTNRDERHPEDRFQNF
jgi:hypothetical protein